MGFKDQTRRPMSLEGKSVNVEGQFRTVGNKIGEGNEGTVYQIEGDRSNVFKIFHENNRLSKKGKIRAMTNKSCRPDDLASTAVVWPESVVEKNGQFLGYKMRKIDQNNWTKALVSAKLLADEPLKKRIRPALDLAVTVEKIHEKGHGLGDFNHQNIWVNEDKFSSNITNSISLLDCDAFHIQTKSGTYGGRTFKVRYSPPEKRPQRIYEVREADKFCLSVHIFQFLMGGKHPYAATGTKSVGGDWDVKIEENKFPYVDTSKGFEPENDGIQQKYNDLPQEIREKFEQIFSQSSTKLSWNRVGVSDWIATLENYLPNYETNVDSGGIIEDPEPPETGETATTIMDRWQNNAPSGDDSGPQTNDDSGPSTGTHEDSEDDIGEKAEGIKDDWGSSNKSSINTSNSESKTEDGSDGSTLDDESDDTLGDKASTIIDDWDGSKSDSEDEDY